MIQHFLRNDPTLVLSRKTKRENPYPWLNVRPDQNLKLYDVNQMVSWRPAVACCWLGLLVLLLVGCRFGAPGLDHVDLLTSPIRIII